VAEKSEEPYACADCDATGAERLARGDKMNHIFCDPTKIGSFWLNRCGPCHYFVGPPAPREVAHE